MPSDRSFAREGAKVDEGGGGSDIALNAGGMCDMSEGKQKVLKLYKKNLLNTKKDLPFLTGSKINTTVRTLGDKAFRG